MHAWEAIQTTLEIIESRIDEEIPIEELADIAGLSLFYYQRLFKRLVKKPVREYVKLRRLARACETLKNTNSRIIDIAYMYGFSSYEVFARAFKIAYNLTPTEYRCGDIGLRNFDKPNLLLNYTMIEMSVPLISEGLVLEINRRTLDKPVSFVGVQGLVSIDGHFPNGEVTGVCGFGEVWQRFYKEECYIPSKVNGRKIGVAFRGDAPEGYLSYFVGVEADMAINKYRIWTLPATEYLIVGFEAENHDELMSTALNKALKYSHMWVERKGLKPGTFGAEIYYNDAVTEPDVAYMEMWSQWLE